MKSISNPKPILTPLPQVSLPLFSSITHSYQHVTDSMARTLSWGGCAVFTTVADGCLVVPLSMLVIFTYDFGYAFWFMLPILLGAVALLIANLNLLRAKTILNVFFANVGLLILTALIHLFYYL